MSLRGRGRGRLSLQIYRQPSSHGHMNDPPLDTIRSVTTTYPTPRTPRQHDDENLRLAALLDATELTQLLECPVCYEIALPPVIMCTSGHNICSDCRKHCSRCPVCRAGFCEARNRLAENIVERCSIVCRYKSLGCARILTGSLMAKHVDGECDFRPVLCRDCKIKVPFDEYINHMLHVENLPKQIATECSTGFDIDEEDFSQFGSSGQSWEPTWLYCYNTDFFCHMESNSHFWWIYVIAFADDVVLEDYLCDILVWNREKKQELRYHGRIHSYRRSGEEILTSGQCLITSENAIRSILNQGGIDVVVCILRAADFQSPTSRITRQPIYSPLSLRDVNATNVAIHTTEALNCGPTNNSHSTSYASTQSLANSGANTPRVTEHDIIETDTVAAQIGNGDFLHENQQQTLSSRTIIDLNAENRGIPPSAIRLSRMDRVTRSQMTRSRSLETGRRRRQGTRVTHL